MSGWRRVLSWEVEPEPGSKAEAPAIPSSDVSLWGPMNMTWQQLQGLPYQERDAYIEHLKAVIKATQEEGGVVNTYRIMQNGYAYGHSYVDARNPEEAEILARNGDDYGLDWEVGDDWDADYSEIEEA